MSSWWSVRRLLLVLLFANTAVVLLVGTIGALAVHETTRTVDVVSQQLGPAQNSNARFMEAMLDAETELRAFTISGERTQLADYRSAVDQAPALAGDMRRYAVDHPSLDRLVRAQDDAARAWQVDFAGPAVARGGGPGTYDAALYERGVARFDAIKAVNRQITELLQAEVADARAAAQHRLDATVQLIAGFGVLGAFGCFLLGWWVTRSIRAPLTDLEDVVDRMAAGDQEARAVPAGPSEIRRLSTALNDLSEENARARVVEQEVQERLREVDRAKSEFVSNVSHELRTPLTIITGYLELLTDDLVDEVDDHQREMFEVTLRNVQRLRLLIEDLLELNRAEGSVPEMEPVDLVAVLSAVAKDVRFGAGLREIRISLDAGETPVLMLADPGQLHRAVLNLASNAVKFSRPGGEVRMVLVVVDDEAEIRIADDGIGIPAQDQAKLGERFFRASNAVAEAFSGTGLGVRIVKSIVDNHQGSFGLTSVEGVGTTVTLRFPVLGDVPDPFDGEQVPVPQR